MGGRFQMVFTVFVVTMWVTTGVWLSKGVWTTTNTLMAVAAAALCSLVFIQFDWVFSYSYAFTAIVLNVIILARLGAPLGALLLASVLIAYGLRLFWFVHVRNQAQSFVARKKERQEAHHALPLAVKVILFVCCTTLMTFLPMTTYLLAVHDIVNPGVVAGVVIAAVGLIIEAVADSQKQRHKEAGSPGWMQTGLWSRTRHPNYAGEILVQFGVVFAALSASVVSGGLAWYETLAALLSPVYIALLMLWSTNNSQSRQVASYGDDPAYLAYRDRTSSLALPPRARAEVRS